MKKLLAQVNGMHKAFNTSTNAYGDTIYDFSSVISSSHNISTDTVCYVLTDDIDHERGYYGSYICTRGEAYATNQSPNGLFFGNGLIEASEDEKTAFIFGKVKLNDEGDKPWSINYHLEVTTSEETLCTEADVYIKGYKKTVNAYYSYNNSNTTAVNSHVILSDDSFIYIGITIYNTEKCTTIPRNWCMKLNNVNRCTFLLGETMINLNDQATINAYGITYVDTTTNGFIEKANNAYSKMNDMYLITDMPGRLGLVYPRPKELYGFQANGEKIIPISSQEGLQIPINSKRNYTEVALDYSKGIFYSDDNVKVNSTSTNIDGCFYSSFSGIDFRYIDNIPTTLDETKPIYLIGYATQCGFSIYVLDESSETGSHMWTQDPSTDAYDYWFLGYPQKTDENGSTYKVNLFETNPIYRYSTEHNQLVPYEGARSFVGHQSTISVSGTPNGYNMDSSVIITPTLASASRLVGEDTSTVLEFDGGLESLSSMVSVLTQVFEDVSVWTGYSSATAKAQVFTGTSTTFTGTYTPDGSVL